MYRIEINPDGEIWHNCNNNAETSSLEIPSDHLQESIKRYCESWESVRAKENGLPLVAVLRACADEVEKRLSGN